MTNDLLKNSIRSLTTNLFLNNNEYNKLYVCHYIFCSYIITGDIFYLKFSLDLLKETMKFNYLYSNKESNNLDTTINYSICISLSLGIELELDDLSNETLGRRMTSQIYNIYKNNFSCKKKEFIDYLSNKEQLVLIILLLIRSKKINKKNYVKFVDIVYYKYSIDKDYIYLSCITILFYFFKKEKIENVFIQLPKEEFPSHLQQIFHIIDNGHKVKKSVTTTNLESLIFSIDNNLKIDLGLIYYHLLYEKTKHHTN